MPVDYAKFTLKPYGFFGKNPALNVPAAVAHCSSSSAPHLASPDAAASSELGVGSSTASGACGAGCTCGH